MATINLSREDKKQILKGNVGLCVEDINYAVDGGVFAERIENCNFEAKRVVGRADDYTVEEDGCYAWEVFPKNADVALKIKTDRHLVPENPHYLRITANENGAGIENRCFDGIFLEKGRHYKCRFYARSYSYRGKVRVQARLNDRFLFTKKIKLHPDGKWHKYSFRVKSRVSERGARFCFTLEKAGVIHVDEFSFMPEEAVLGALRRDLARYLKDFKPGFLRFVTGSPCEENGYEWKSSLGKKVRRKHFINGWALYGANEKNGYCGKFSHYGQTLGMGYFEYFRLSEYLGAKPLPVVCMNGLEAAETSAQIEVYAQRAIDVAEFALGGSNTVFGRERIDTGHAQPFALTYMAVEAKNKNEAFYENLALVEQKLQEKYPTVQFTRQLADKVVPASPTPEWLYEHANDYDNVPRTEKVHAVEYAPRTLNGGNGSHIWKGALAEAAFMTGIERNGDMVVAHSFAPVFARIGYEQYSPSLVYFDDCNSYPSASYYIQQLFRLYSGDYVLGTSCDEKNLYVSATEQEGMTFVKVVNAGDEALQTTVESDVEFGSLMRIIRMQAGLDERCDGKTQVISPVEVAPASANEFVVPPHSFQVLVFNQRLRK